MDDLLLTVERPGRYVGGEWNMVRKEWTAGRVKFLLAFPDVYEVGMSYLGLKILYGILNGRDDCLCERAFAPWKDFEEVLRKNGISLFSLESRRPLTDFDMIGFSLAYELNYTNVLNILDLGGIPARSLDRQDSDPVILAGGPSCYNPEPMAEFIDAFIVGDGEEVVSEIVAAYKAVKGGGGKKKDFLKTVSGIEGVYVPSFYKVEYGSEGRIRSFSPAEKGAPSRIRKRAVKDLDNSFYPTGQIVPSIQAVHDRITLEIMRGCKHACRFCQAGAAYRPCRERSVERILELAKETYGATGYDEISLLSLSSGDHSRIRPVMEGINKLFPDKAVSISVPSLRIENVLEGLPFLISEVKKSGLTFAPEAGSERLRHAINKKIDIENLFRAVSESFRHGWNRVKLYFLIGLPTEDGDDIAGMIDLITGISDLKRAIDGNSAYVTASINAFVPKPHTPFQWEAMEELESLRRKQGFLKSRIRSKKIKLDFRSLEMSRLEAALSRGDRRLSAVIYDAWKGGDRFTAWENTFDYGRWAGPFGSAGIDPDSYITRKTAFDEILPWDFIDIGLSKDWLVKEASAVRPQV